ncbi:MAG: PaaI family thioesterase [Gammaproteobacteria bacterium]|nr:PaaI family thioesterase [Gammaproteobacteria bacterium]
MDEREIPNYWLGQCFGCSKTNPHGLRLQFWRSEHGCFTRCSIPGYLCGIDGLVHGGIIALLLDEVAQWALIGRHASFGVTREITVRYLRPVPVDAEFLVEAHVVSQEEKNVMLRSTVFQTPGVPLAEADSKFILVSPTTIAKLSAVEEPVLRQFLSKYATEAAG